MDKNRELHELLGHDWHLIIYHAESPNIIEYWSCSCGKILTNYYLMKEHLKKNNPDYAADPRLVLKELMKRKDWDNFSEFVLIAHTGLCVTSMVVDSSVQLVLFPLYYISDTTGKLRDMAIEWLKGEKNESRK